MDQVTRHAVWTLRLGFGAWLVPAGLNHFYPLFPQPLGNQPESTALITALIDSGLFAVVKAVELFAGLALLVGWRAPLALLMLLPVSFNVWYWDVPLQGWGSISAYYGWAVLGATVLLMASWHRSYADLLEPEGRTSALLGRLLVPARLLLGLLMVAVPLNHFTGPVLPFPVGNTAMAYEFLEALYISRLLDVAMGLQLMAGVLVLVNRWTALALAAAMPVLVCMAYWAVILEGDLGWSALALVLVALAALVMLAHLPTYAEMLAARPLAVGESEAQRYERLYAWPVGQTAPRAFAWALVPLALAAAFYHFIVPSMLAFYCLMVLIWPLGVLVLRLAQGLLVQPERSG